MTPRLRIDPLEQRDGAADVAREALRVIADGGSFVVHVERLEGKAWRARRGHWVAWVDICGEDEFGMIGHSAHSAGSAMRQLGHNLERALHVLEQYPSYFKKYGYREAGWAYADEAWGLARGSTEHKRKKGIQ